MKKLIFGILLISSSINLFAEERGNQVTKISFTENSKLFPDDSRKEQDLFFCKNEKGIMKKFGDTLEVFGALAYQAKGPSTRIVCGHSLYGSYLHINQFNKAFEISSVNVCRKIVRKLGSTENALLFKLVETQPFYIFRKKPTTRVVEKVSISDKSCESLRLDRETYNNENDENSTKVEF